MKEQIRTYPIFFWKLLYNRQLKPMDNLKKDQIEVVTIDTNQNNYQESSTFYYCRSGVRLWALPNFKGKLIGFRIAVDYD